MSTSMLHWQHLSRTTTVKPSLSRRTSKVSQSNRGRRSWTKCNHNDNFFLRQPGRRETSTQRPHSLWEWTQHPVLTKLHQMPLSLCVSGAQEATTAILIDNFRKEKDLKQRHFRMINSVRPCLCDPPCSPKRSSCHAGAEGPHTIEKKYNICCCASSKEVYISCKENCTEIRSISRTWNQDAQLKQMF